MTFGEYSKLLKCGFKYNCIETGRTTTVCPVQFIEESDVTPFEVNLPDTYWAEIKDGRIIGGSSVVITKDGYMLYDMLANSRLYEANMTDYGLCLIGGSPRHIGKYYIYNYLKKDSKKITDAISLACYMSGNYYHFMQQVASRFYLLSLINIDKNIPLVIDESVLKITQMKEVINALNIDNRPIIGIKANQLFHVERLYIISEPHIVVPNSFAKAERRTQNFAFDKNALNYIKETLFNRIPTCNDKYPTRIFISRKGCAKRRCNEDELEKVFSKFGFKSLNIENLSIAQQMVLFGNAEHVIGGSGAAFTNIMYCKKGTKATLFFTGHHNITCFSSLGVVNGVMTYYAYPEVETSEIHTGYYVINPDIIYNHLESLYDNEQIPV